MLLTLTTTTTDLGYLLHKNPQRLHSKELPFGTAHLFYPEASAERCTAALMVEVDPIGLVRSGNVGGSLFDHYVNDRPYAASSFLAVAIGRVLASAMAGRSTERQALADSPIPLAATIAPLPCRGGVGLLERLFRPLGYQVEATPHLLDPAHPAWGDSRYLTVRLSGSVRLADLLTHLFVLVPVLDNAKHYYVGDDEVAKLLAKGAGWLETHPERELIVRRYLKHQRSLARAALEGLGQGIEPTSAEDFEAQAAGEEGLEAPQRLNDRRLDAVVDALIEAGATSVVDLGCGEGKLLARLMAEPRFEKIAGVEVAPRVLARAAERLKLDRMTPRQRERIDLMQGSLTYRDRRLAGFDAAAVVEVIEHIEPSRLTAFETALFATARPRVVVVTTPNIEFNQRFAGMAPGALRHPDHRFEWTRREFEDWAGGVAARHGYRVRFDAIGDVYPTLGAPTQMGVFTTC
jgi:3' terminal RNA ribose 2'-O-methyltransferase Hen1